MHKITKGLKKKKKGKKSKKGEDELFKPEELENYRREHQSSSSEPPAQNEEWKKFIALTSEVDDILKKTQGDLDRIKSTSFFQRKPTESEVRKLEEESKEAAAVVEQEAARSESPPKPSGIVEVSESESEEEEDDTLFDTNYIDVIASGEVKLAYIPESPTEQPGDDPFDTSIAERAILGPEVERKGRKLVPLGAAVEVLTGRVQLPTCATKRPTSRRQILKERDLLLGSFEDPSSLNVNVDTTEEVKNTLLDDDSIPLPDEPIDLTKPIIPPELLPTPIPNPSDAIKSIVQELEDDDIEFEELAAESLSKSAKPVESVKIEWNLQEQEIAFGAFEPDTIQNSDADVEIDDPFDTSFAQNVLPDSTLASIDPILNTDISIHSSSLVNKLLEDDDDFDPRADEKPKERTLSRPDVLNIAGPRTVSFELPSPQRDALDADAKVIKPLTPFYTRKNSIPELPVEEDDPFDTSFAVNIAPGKAELKVIESELFDPNIEKKLSLEDKNFDPRDERLDKINKVLNTVNEISNPKVTSLAQSVDLLAIDSDISAKVLTPQGSIDSGEILYKDPFDTSAISNILPGKTELKLLESELIHSDTEISNKGNTVLPVQNSKGVDDLLTQKEDIVFGRPLSPAANFSVPSIEEQDDFDPFDTSCVDNIQPGRVELKLLESELIHN